MGERASKYLAKYLKERYDVVKLRREVAEELKEFAKSKKLTLSDAVSYLLASARASLALMAEKKEERGEPRERRWLSAEDFSVPVSLPGLKGLKCVLCGAVFAAPSVVEKHLKGWHRVKLAGEGGEEEEEGL